MDSAVPGALSLGGVPRRGLGYLANSLEAYTIARKGVGVRLLSYPIIEMPFWYSTVFENERGICLSPYLIVIRQGVCRFSRSRLGYVA